MFYDAKCWAVDKQKISVAKISVAKMKILRWIRLASIDQKIKGELFEMIWSCAKESCCSTRWHFLVFLMKTSTVHIPPPNCQI